MKKSSFLYGVVALALLAPAAASAQALSQVGQLTCQMGPSVGLIVGSSQRMTCVFVRNNGDREAYNATFRRLGLDIGISAGGKLVWGVLARTEGLAPRALAGKYLGVSSDIAVGLGVGANAMVGGSRRTITLQPLSVEGSAGVGVALGAAGFTLK